LSHWVVSSHDVVGLSYHKYGSKTWSWPHACSATELHPQPLFMNSKFNILSLFSFLLRYLKILT
jgi:hypothetical protein